MLSRRLFKIKLHTTRVVLLKTSLPIFAFLLAATILIWPALVEQKDKFSLAVKPQTSIKGSKIDMEKVRFYSVDGGDQPITVVASTIKETDPEKQIVTLSDPVAQYKMNNGVILTAKTPYGLAFQKEEYLYLEDQVITTSDNGYTMYSSKVICDYDKGTLDSDESVDIQGPAGTLKAEGFFVFNKGDNIDFKKKTKTLILQTKENIDIFSDDGLKIDQKKRTITAFKNVKVIQKDKVIHADKMIAYYTDKKISGKSELERIVATGNVIAYGKDISQKIMGEKGEYDPKTGIITMTGNVVIAQGNSRMYGDTATLDLNKSMTSLNMSERKERIKGQLIPAELEKGL